MHGRIIYLFLLLLVLEGCSKIDKARDFLTNPTAREVYQRDLKISDELFAIWESEKDKSLKNDSISIGLPYRESGRFFPKSFLVYSYLMELHGGDLLSVKIKQDSTSSLTFIDIFSVEDSAYKNIKSSGFGEQTLQVEIEEDNIYKIVVQPEIDASSFFTIEIKRSPLYHFPVAGGKNSDAQSFWGAQRDGGKRSHKGVDIFAKRGTPVIAAVDGRITSSGEKGLGGKQVWLRDPKRGQSLYYAHLDSIAAIKKYQVKAGDTLGFVGNTGNARTTAPHLHFGIYRRFGGAINPYHFIKQEENEPPKKSPFLPGNQLGVVKNKANIRNSNSIKNSEIIQKIPAGDTIQILGKTDDWYHIKAPNSKIPSFLHSSLAAPIN
ncbi:murein DD-endopeptidase MepM/ murein hydrolase activator NlpD [Gillisia sp. Hel_I_86]|uniref:M23 family metallopeptidase n=1 Tax=Gillisia sp. Hel_I_86 TaxID=1249981 RepID=UPI00119A16D1|nr:M23 family metallopeptidase [Gillisia sp. Hel_I_86]TVZ26458.1 murein DD-endopeptidase MepM/ murein hydrolase activator NlpD [Gillisia sp. Hel_I_86]